MGQMDDEAAAFITTGRVPLFTKNHHPHDHPMLCCELVVLWSTRKTSHREAGRLSTGKAPAACLALMHALPEQPHGDVI